MGNLIWALRYTAQNNTGLFIVILLLFAFAIFAICMAIKSYKKKKAATGTKHFDSNVAAKRSWVVGVIAGIIITLIIKSATELTLISVIAGTITMFIVSGIMTAILTSGSSTARNISIVEECEKNHLRPLESDVDFQKMIILAKNHGFKNKTNEEYRKLYSDGLAMYNHNKSVDDKTETMQKSQEGHIKDLNKKTELIKYARYCLPSNLREKRCAMIKGKLSELKKELEGLKAFERSMKSPSKSDPYIHGGIASAIGGPVAGAMAATNVAAENAKTAAGAAANYALFGRSTADKIAMTERKINKYNEALQAAQIALTSEMLSTDEAEKLLNVHTINMDVTEGNSLHILVPVQLSQDVSVQTLPAVLDGIIHAKVFMNGSCVDSTPLVLPIWGVNASEEIILEGLFVNMPSAFQKEDCKITIEIDKTWLIEKNNTLV